jgi:hypothetical protein
MIMYILLELAGNWIFHITRRAGRCSMCREESENIGTRMNQLHGKNCATGLPFLHRYGRDVDV